MKNKGQTTITTTSSEIKRDSVFCYGNSVAVFALPDTNVSEYTEDLGYTIAKFRGIQKGDGALGERYSVSLCSYSYVVDTQR